MLRLSLLPLLLVLVSLTGVRYEHRTLEGPISAHILDVDPKCVRIEPAHASPDILSLENVSDIAKRNNAFAAVNGGFFRMRGKYAGSSSGILKIHGEWFSSPRHERAAIGWSRREKKPLIDRVDLKTTLRMNGTSIEIDGINQPDAKDKITLYSSAFYEHTLTSRGCCDVGFDSLCQVVGVNKKGKTEIPKQGYVASFGEQCWDFAVLPKQGTPAQLTFEVLPLHHPDTAPLWNRFDEIVGGTPLLIDNGKVISDFSGEKTLLPFLEDRHPRTAIGIKPDGHWLFVVIDGRMPDLSIGMTMVELAHFMHTLGCTSALNLDGGGSSTLYLDGKVVNTPSPSDEDGKVRGSERPVSDAVLIWAN